MPRRAELDRYDATNLLLSERQAGTELIALSPIPVIPVPAVVPGTVF
jgi:hypothetical protein